MLKKILWTTFSRNSLSVIKSVKLNSFAAVKHLKKGVKPKNLSLIHRVTGALIFRLLMCASRTKILWKLANLENTVTFSIGDHVISPRSLKCVSKNCSKDSANTARSILFITFAFLCSEHFNYLGPTEAGCYYQLPLRNPNDF